MKRRILTLVCLLLTLSFLLTAFAACGGGKDDAEGKEGENTNTPTGGGEEGGKTDPRDAILAKIAEGFRATAAYTGDYTVKTSEAWGSSTSTILETANAATNELAKKETYTYNDGEESSTNVSIYKVVKDGDSFNEYNYNTNGEDDPYISYQAMNPLDVYLYLHPEKQRYYYGEKNGLDRFVSGYVPLAEMCANLEGIAAYLDDAAKESENEDGATYTFTFEVKEEDGKQILQLIRKGVWDEEEEDDDDDEGGVASVGTSAETAGEEPVMIHCESSDPITLTVKDGKVFSIVTGSTEIATKNGEKVKEETETNSVEFAYALDTEFFNGISVADVTLTPAYVPEFGDVTLPVIVDGEREWIETWSISEPEDAADCVAKLQNYQNGNFGYCTMTFYTDEALTAPLTVADTMSVTDFELLFFRDGVYAKLTPPEGYVLVKYVSTYDLSGISAEYMEMFESMIEFFFTDGVSYETARVGSKLDIDENYSDSYEETDITVNGETVTLEDEITTEEGVTYVVTYKYHVTDTFFEEDD